MQAITDKAFLNQTVIISGGIGDIGFATAKEFAALGANVALGGINGQNDAKDFLAEIANEFGVACIYHQVDVADPKAVHSWIDSVVSSLGIPQLIVANAAVVTLAGIHDVTPEQWAREIDVNLNGAFYLTQVVTARLKEASLPGRVVFVGSWAGSRVHAHMPAYSVSKAGMTMLCKCMALDLAPHGILVNEIAPGYVNAGLSGKIWEANPGRSEVARQKVPIKKVINPKEVAQQIVFLCHPHNTQMTGSTLLMDGGLSLL